MNDKLKMIAALASLGIGYCPMMPSFGKSKPTKEPELKPCLNCGVLKQHNNSFCSGKCCKEHRVKGQ